MYEISSHSYSRWEYLSVGTMSWRKPNMRLGYQIRSVGATPSSPETRLGQRPMTVTASDQTWSTVGYTPNPGRTESRRLFVSWCNSNLRIRSTSDPYATPSCKMIPVPRDVAMPEKNRNPKRSAVNQVAIPPARSSNVIFGGCLLGSAHGTSCCQVSNGFLLFYSARSQSRQHIL